MNPIIKAIDDLKFKIPMQVLQIAFQRDEWNYYNPNLSLDEQIRLKVINPRVLFDCNMVGGQQVTIPLDGLQPIMADQYIVVYNIPPERTANRTIISVLSVGYMPYQANFNLGMGNVSFASPLSMNSVTHAGQRIADSVSVLPVISNSQVEIIGHNTIAIRESRVTSLYFLRCVVENEENLNNIMPRTMYNLSKLIELAVKSYIYNKLRVRIDQAFLQGGQELGAVKEIVDSYADSEEMYQTYLRETWARVSVMNDHAAYDRIIKLSISPGM
jgi:hypothetical protein